MVITHIYNVIMRICALFRLLNTAVATAVLVVIGSKSHIPYLAEVISPTLLHYRSI